MRTFARTRADFAGRSWGAGLARVGRESVAIARKRYLIRRLRDPGSPARTSPAAPRPKGRTLPRSRGEVTKPGSDRLRPARDPGAERDERESRDELRLVQDLRGAMSHVEHGLYL